MILRKVLKTKEVIPINKIINANRNLHVNNNNFQKFFKKKAYKLNPGVSVILCTNRINRFDEVFDNFIRQNYDYKELIVILNNNEMELEKYTEKAEEYKNIKIFQLDEKLSLGHCFKFALNHSKYDYIAKFDDDEYYGRDYLTEAMEAFKKFRCNLVGKASYYIYFNKKKILAHYGEQRENIFVNRVADSSLVFNRRIFDKINIPLEKKAGVFAIIQTQLGKMGEKFYSTTAYNYLVNRYDDLEHNHTWKISDEDYLSYHFIKIVAEDVGTDDYIPYIEKRK